MGIGSAEDVLEIVGPSEVFEGEQVVFQVLLNDEPVQAKVVLGEVRSSLTDELSGEVMFEMPQVPFEGESFVLTAWIAGNVSVSTSIFVKNVTGALEVVVSDSEISELEEFRLTVSANDIMIDDAVVWFNSQQYVTDVNGVVEVVAPDVLVTTTVGLYVNKSGYGSYSDTIRVLENGVGNQLFELMVPAVVVVNETELLVQVVGLDGGVSAVEVSVWYEDVLQETIVTDDEGRALVMIPSVINEDFFEISVEKVGFQTLSGVTNKKVYFFYPITGPELVVDITPSEAAEGEAVVIEVTDIFGRAVDGATIWFGDNTLTGVTDQAGTISMRAPVVFFDRELQIFALKQGYNLGEGFVTVRNTPGIQNLLIIKGASVINESESFSLLIMDSSEIPVSDVAVWFHDQLRYSNDSGEVMFEAPEVDSNEMFWVNVSHSGYTTSSMMVEIVNVDNALTEDVLQVSVIPSVLEGDVFSVTVRTIVGTAVAGARVEVDDTVYYTDYTGSVEISAPEVSWDSLYDISVSRVGYQSVSTEIMVKNQEGFEYWFLVIIICAALVIGGVSYYRSRIRF